MAAANRGSATAGMGKFSGWSKRSRLRYRAARRLKPPEYRRQAARAAGLASFLRFIETLGADHAERPLVDQAGALGRRVPGIASALLDAAIPIVAADLLVQQPLDRFRDVVRVLRPHENRGVARDLTENAGVRRHDRSAAGHGFEQRDPEALVQGREDEGGRAAVEQPEDAVVG